MAKKIMIADDEEMIRNLVKVSLREDDYEILEARDGLEALNLAKEKMPDLIILDIMMPGMVGYIVCKELKNNPETKKIIIFFLTSRSSTFSIKTTIENAGGDGLINKPFDPLELRQKIKKALGD
jgi:CheY-like chemotaxis protein